MRMMMMMYDIPLGTISMMGRASEAYCTWLVGSPHHAEEVNACLAQHILIMCAAETDSSSDHEVAAG